LYLEGLVEEEVFGEVMGKGKGKGKWMGYKYESGKFDIEGYETERTRQDPAILCLYAHANPILYSCTHPRNKKTRSQHIHQDTRSDSIGFNPGPNNARIWIWI
jgi:hypothetical protein